MSREDQDYWAQILKQVDVPLLRTLMSKLDPAHPIGIRTLPKGSHIDPAAGSSNKEQPSNSTLSSSSAVKQLGIPCCDFFLEVKRKHPRAIALVQIGDFYESVGHDAIILCQLHGLNPMAPGKGVARCGVPLANLPRAVRAMNQEDLSVAICPEVEKTLYGSKAGPKSRYVRAISTPSNPFIFYEAAEGGGSSEDYYKEGLPLIGVASSKSGHMFYEYRHELKSVLVTEGMTPEVLISRLQNQRAAPPLLLHSSVREVTSSMTSSMELLIKGHARGVNVVKVFSTPQPTPTNSAPSALEGFLDQVRLEMDMKPGEPIKEIESSRHLRRGEGPIPPYLATINNLGLNNSPGMPNLLDALLDPSRSGRTSAEPRRWIEGLLRQPPPPFMAIKIHEAARCLWVASCPLPSVYSMMTAKKVVDILSKEDQAAPSFFRELAMLLEPALELLTPNPARSVVPLPLTMSKRQSKQTTADQCDQLLPAAEGALAYASWEMQIHVPKPKLLVDLSESLKEIRRVVDMTGEGSGVPRSWASDESEEEEGEGNEVGVVDGQEKERDGSSQMLTPLADSSTATRPSVGAAKRRAPFSHDQNIEQVMQRLEESNEGRFLGRISPDIMAPYIIKVQKLRLAIDKEVRRLMIDLSDEKDLAKHRPRVKYDEDDRAVFIHVSKNSLALRKESTKALDLKTPVDRRGKVIPDGKVSPRLESLSAEYRLAVDESCREVRRQLQVLCRSLQPKAGSLLLCASSSIIARALIDHVDEAKRKGWCLPTMVRPQEDPQASKSIVDGEGSKAEVSGRRDDEAMRMRMELHGLWPYWKQKEEAVKNDLVLERTILLTGPNMAGKSTVLRSVAAIALLAACGLAVPAESAPSVPFYDSFMLRNYSGDSPLENLSSFALEMADVKAMLRDATGRSLILLDELGKGTEVDAATALSAALLESLCKRGSSVVFATHLHDLVRLMEKEEEGGRLRYMNMQVLPKTTTTTTTIMTSPSPSPSSDKMTEAFKLEPTWRIVPGSCTESLACQVALESGIDPSIVSRADQIYSQLRGERQRAAVALRSAGDAFIDKPPSEIPLPAPLSDSSSSTTIPVSTEFTALASFSLEDAKEVLLEVASSLLKPSNTSHVDDLSSKTDQEEGDGDNHDNQAAASDDDQSSMTSSSLQVHTCGPNQDPPPSHSLRSATYVVLYKSGYFYCGDSDSIRDRLMYHRKKTKSTGSGRASHKGPGCSIAYVMFESGEGGKSLARKIQMRTIKELKRRGFPMASSGDETLKSFGG